MGPRACIGQKFAMMEAKIIAALILKKFDLTLTKEEYGKYEPKFHITVRPFPNLVMSLHRLNN